MLKLILEALDHLAKRLSENDKTVSADEVRTVLEDCEQTIHELGLLLNSYQQFDNQPGPSKKPLLARPSLKSHGNDWGMDCNDIETLRTLLQARVKTLLSLSSKVASCPPDPSVNSDGPVDAVDNPGMKSWLLLEDEQGTKAGRKPKQSSAQTTKVVDPKAYHRLEKRLQTKKSPFDLPRSGSFSNLSYVDSAPLSPLTTEFGGKSVYPTPARERTGDTPRRPSTESDQDALQLICTRLAVAITQHSINPRLATSKAAQARGSSIVFRHPFSEPPLNYPNLDLPGGITAPTPHPGRSYITKAQHEAFEKKLLENAAVLCEERALCVEYTEWNAIADDWNMVQAASNCRVLLIRRLKGRSQGTPQFATSIWVLSSDRSVRMEHELDNQADTIPYTGWGDTVKVAIRMNARLTFHDISPDAGHPEHVQTSWTNYVFERHTGSTSFQSALIDRTLTMSVRTVKTTRVHDGITGIMKENEHLCGLENLRVWMDQGTGEVFAMIHFKPQFRIGYMIFQLNSAVHPLMLKEDGHRNVKITGLDMPAEGRRSSHSRFPKKGSENEKSKPDKRSGSIRIEFATEEERDLFVQKYWSVADVTVN